MLTQMIIEATSYTPEAHSSEIQNPSRERRGLFDGIKEALTGRKRKLAHAANIFRTLKPGVVEVDSARMEVSDTDTGRQTVLYEYSFSKEDRIRNKPSELNFIADTVVIVSSTNPSSIEIWRREDDLTTDFRFTETVYPPKPGHCTMGVRKIGDIAALAEKLNAQ